MSRHYNTGECTLELTVAGGNLVQRSKYIWKGAISVIKLTKRMEVQNSDSSNTHKFRSLLYTHSISHSFM